MTRDYSILNNSVYHTKTVLLLKISISTLFSSILPIDRILSGATTQGQSGHVSYGSEVVLRIPQSSSITGISPSDFLVSYPGHLWRCLIPLQRCSRCILQTQLTEQYLFGDKIIQNCLKIYATHSYNYDLLLRQETLKKIACPGS